MLRAVFTRFGLALIAVAILLSASLAQSSSASAAGGFAGYVYTETNPAGPNTVAVFGRGADGSLTALSPIPTGGTGTGASLGSQGALALNEDGKWLFAVNAGSNDVSLISLKDGTVTSRVNSGGTTPVSVTVYKKWVYVLNAGSDNISGFTWKPNGALAPIPGSTKPLSGAGVGGAQIQFSPDGNVLVVTEKATNRIDTYRVDKHGVTSGPISHPSSGATPFGFDFAKQNTLVVSEAPGSAASSYRVSDDGGISLITGSVANGQSAACWLVVSKNGKYAYTANAGNGTISSYTIAHNGSLTLLNGTAGTPGGHPIDEAISENGKFLYVLNTGVSTLGINAFAVKSDGSLASLGITPGTPVSAAGLVAR